MVRKRKYILISLMLGSIFLLTGCQKSQESTVANKDVSQPSTSNEANNDQKGYMYQANGITMFIQWTEADKQVSGQLQIVHSDNKNSRKLLNDTHAFKGVHNGSDISISFSGSIWDDSFSGLTWTGTMKNNELSLVVPNRNGGFDTFVFSSGTVAGYNKIVVNLQQQIGNQVMQAQRQAAQDQANKNREKLLRALDDGVNNLISYTKKLSSDTKLDDVLGRYAQHWSKIQADNQRMKQGASVRPLTDVQIGKCQVDVGSMETDRGSLDVRQTSINDDISYIKNSIAATQKAWDSVNSQGISSSYSESDISTMIGDGQDQINSSTKALEKSQNQATSYEEQAKQLLQSAQQFVSGLKSTN